MSVDQPYRMTNRTLDSSPIGDNVPSTGKFSQSQELGTSGTITMSTPRRNPLESAAEIVTANKTLDAADSGKLLYIAADALVMTLPATVVGLCYTFINAGEDGANIITIAPNASDQIIGIDLTAADDKDVINIKATAKKGDYIKLMGNGTTGWLVLEAGGSWAREA